jgi:putative photosynthetic complex assembly protein
MHASDTNNMIPRGFLLAAGALIAASMLMALVARVTDIGAVRVVAPNSIESIDLRLEDRGHGKTAVIDARSDRVLKIVPPGQDGFIRVAISGLEFDRRARGAPSGDFRLGRAADGSYWLHDLATGRFLQLEAFGNTNVKSFAQFLPAGRIVE